MTVPIWDVPGGKLGKNVAFAALTVPGLSALNLYERAGFSTGGTAKPWQSTSL